MAELFYKDLCYRLNGLFYKIQNIIGSSASEKQYQDVLAAKLDIEGMAYEREKELYFNIDGKLVGGNRPDFIVENKVVVDVKAKKYITREDFKQTLRYLKSGNYKLGLVVNFGGSRISIKRVVNSAIRI